MYLKKEDKIQVNSKEPVYRLVNDYSKFFTINSCVYKYITFLSSNKPDEVLNVLDKDFINQNNITLDNIYNYVSKLDVIYTFKSKNDL